MSLQDLVEKYGPLPPERAVHYLQQVCQALREAQPGIALPADSEWQREFEGSFPYPETPDQLTSLAEIKADMGRARPMDRLLCGDVGYGKTEVAMRAAFKAVEAYDPVLNRWQVLPSMPHPRHGLAVGAVGNRLYTVSGDGQSAGSGIDHSAVAFNEILQVDLVLK